MNLDTEKVLSLTIQEAYQLFQIIRIETQEPELEQTYQQTRFGYKTKFDIYNLFSGNYTEKRKTSQIIIEQKRYELKDFYTEIETREANLKKAILENLEEETLHTPR